jgi:predicted MFS family arabinose efflux permease
LNEKFGWRSTLWFLAISGTVQFLLLLFFLPETMRKPQNDTDTPMTRWQVFKVYIIDPLKLLRLLRYPPVILAITIAAVAFGTLVCSSSSYLTLVLLEHLHYLLIFSSTI